VLGAITTLLFAVAKAPPESAAEEGKKVVLTMLAVGVVFLLVIAVGELSHHVGRARRRRDG
jgi:hypothetical protein